VEDGATKVPPGVFTSSKAGVNGGAIAFDNLLGPAPPFLVLEWLRDEGDAVAGGALGPSESLVSSFLALGVGVL